MQEEVELTVEGKLAAARAKIELLQSALHPQRLVRPPLVPPPANAYGYVGRSTSPRNTGSI
eukprot:SAG31_NODE_272_length_18690_cov_14.520785_17_plen_61_part_00